MENNVKSSMKPASVIAVLAGAADASAPEETTADDTSSTSASSDEEDKSSEAADDSGQNLMMNYIGNYINGSATMTVSCRCLLCLVLDKQFLVVLGRSIVIESDNINDCHQFVVDFSCVYVIGFIQRRNAVKS